MFNSNLKTFIKKKSFHYFTYFPKSIVLKDIYNIHHYQTIQNKINVLFMKLILTSYFKSTNRFLKNTSTTMSTINPFENFY